MDINCVSPIHGQTGDEADDSSFKQEQPID